MDVLTNKSMISRDNVSRYAPFYFYYHTLDKKYIYGITNQLSDDIPYVEVKINSEDTLDILANKYYGRPDYFWVIADFNKIIDPFIKISDYHDKLKIPALASIEYEE